MGVGRGEREGERRGRGYLVSNTKKRCPVDPKTKSRDHLFSDRIKRFFTASYGIVRLWRGREDNKEEREEKERNI